MSWPDVRWPDVSWADVRWPDMGWPDMSWADVRCLSYPAMLGPVSLLIPPLRTGGGGGDGTGGGGGEGTEWSRFWARLLGRGEEY